MGGCINKGKNVIIRKVDKSKNLSQTPFSKIKRKNRIYTFKTKEFKKIDSSFHTFYSNDMANEFKSLDIKSYEDNNCKTFQAILEYF